MSGVKVTADNAESILAALASLSKMDVLVGIPENNANREDGEALNNAEIAYLQSTGGDVILGGQTVTLPPRPFLDIGIEDSADITSGHLANAASDAMDGNLSGARKALEMAGQVARDSAQRVISDGDRLEQLSQQTIERRKKAKPPITGEKPLWARGHLKQAINYVVRTK